MPPPRANPRAFDFSEKFWSNAAETVKCPTRLSFKEGQIPHPPGMLKQLWKQVLQNFQPLRIPCSACLRSTL